MPSSCSPLFLTLTPLDPFLPPQSIVFLPSDRFDLQLGGNKHEDYVRPSACPSPANFLFARHALGVEHASLSFLGDGLVGLVHNHSRDTTLVNDRRLKIAERSSLRDGDIIQLGFYESWDSSTEFVLGLQVHLQDYPARSSLAPAGDRGILFIPAPVSVFKHLHLTINRLEDLTQQLTSTQQQLKEALDRQTTHICTPPRPYGQLLSALVRVSVVLRPEPLSLSIISFIVIRVGVIRIPGIHIQTHIILFHIRTLVFKNISLSFALFAPIIDIVTHDASFNVLIIADGTFIGTDVVDIVLRSIIHLGAHLSTAV
ncbi:unnamed protein product [Tilletia laevis]|uniref:FHA domain-containing protein n=2 Tax=Tilletia TaxID=13289 RepID=A0A9N8QFS2_9BASI|nr:unnamed protein product [Tilletia caries]CAD6941238.1 unnamed protein product [Tilletia laevis]CAD6952893.1 unnamed protein product [Tilletia laevis]CAD6954928.1 unnamed protein product [Tilletia caries]CAD7066893.1 unnamed protein product [Tilletia caries]